MGKPFKLESGELSNLEVIYETYGAINSNGNNCILICHALTGDHHAAGTHESSEKPGWWNHLIGPGKPIDTERFFVVCSSCLGACGGTTGPTSQTPDSLNQTYGMDFPDFTIKDMINAQKSFVGSSWG